MIWGSLHLHELHVGKEKLSKTIRLTQLCASTTSYTTISWDQEPQSIHANCGSWTSFPKDTLTKIWPPILLKVTWLESLSQKQCNFYDKVWRAFSYRTKVPGHRCPMFHDLFTKITHSLTMSLTIILSTNTHWVPALCQVPTRQRWSLEILAMKHRQLSTTCSLPSQPQKAFLCNCCSTFNSPHYTGESQFSSLRSTSGLLVFWKSTESVVFLLF